MRIGRGKWGVAVIVFRIRRSGGTFGTTLTGALSDSINPRGFVAALSLRLFHLYTFPFARTSMAFADGRRLSGTLTRSCRVSP